MANENNGVNKDVSSSLNNYTDYAHKGTNAALDTAYQINKWYANELNKIANADAPSTRLETNVDNSMEEAGVEQQKYTKLETKVDEYDELQTITNNKTTINKTSRIKTQLDANILENGEDQEETTETADVSNGSTKTVSKVPKRIATVIKGAKFVNNSANRMIKTGKTISTGMNEGGIKTFEKSSSRIMTKPVKKVANKITNKATKKATNILVKTGTKIAKTTGKQAVKGATKLLLKIVQLLAKLVMSVVKMIIAMLPEIAPVIIIIVVIATFCSFFGLGMSDDTKNDYEDYMITTQEEYNKSTVEFYNQGKVVDGAIDGKGMINWRAPLSILQMLNGDLTYDSAEKELLEEFKKAELFEKITEETYTYEKET